MGSAAELVIYLEINRRGYPSYEGAIAWGKISRMSIASEAVDFLNRNYPDKTKKEG